MSFCPRDSALRSTSREKTSRGQGVTRYPLIQVARVGAMSIHDDRCDRPSSIFGGETTIHSGPSRNSFLLLPIIPKGRT